jgi:hypothetical protein
MKTRTLQLISGITLVAGFIFMNVSNSDSLKADALGLMLVCLPTFLYASHVVGMENSNRKEGTDE